MTTLKTIKLNMPNGPAGPAVTHRPSVRGRLLSGLDRLISRRGERISASRALCCHDAELTSDIWFDGFPELVERKARLQTMYCGTDWTPETEADDSADGIGAGRGRKRPRPSART